MFQTKFDAEKRVWCGNDAPPFFNSQISLGQVILKALAVHGSKVSQISDDTGSYITFDEMKNKTVRVAQNLQTMGYQPKQVFSFMAKNSEHLAPTVFASFCIGCAVNTMDTSFGKTETIHMLKITKPRLMFCDVEVYQMVAECLEELKNDAKIFTFGGQVGKSKAVESLFAETGEAKYFTPVSVDGINDVCMVICSSGTTGFSKGVSLSHAALLDEITQFYMLNTDDVLFSYSSLYWLSGVLILLLSTLNGAARVITKQKFSPEFQLQLIQKHKLTFLINPPYQMILMLKSEAIQQTNLSSVKHYMVGGSKVSQNVPNEMNKYLPNGKVVIGYGTTEVGIVSLTYLQDADKETVGCLVNGVVAKVIDENGHPCGVGVDGELCFKANYKFLGYYGKTDSNHVTDSDGFFVTGDIGHFDEHGFLYIVDRKKEMLKYRNFQVSPSEIESFLVNSPKVKSVCIVGIPDEIAGDLPAAVVVPNTTSSEVFAEELSKMVSDHFSDQSKLRGGVYFIGDEELPLTASGKIIRRKVKELAIRLLKEKTAI